MLVTKALTSFVLTQMTIERRSFGRADHRRGPFPPVGFQNSIQIHGSDLFFVDEIFNILLKGSDELPGIPGAVDTFAPKNRRATPPPEESRH